MSRLRRSAEDTSRIFRDHPVRLAVIVTVLNIPGALVAAFLPDEEAGGLERVALVVGAVVAGTALLIAILFTWAFLTAPRRELEERMGLIAGAVSELYDHAFGDVGTVRPMLHALLVEVREASGMLRAAQEENSYWGWTISLPKSEWKKAERDLTKRLEYQELCGVLVEAYAQVKRMDRVANSRLWGPNKRQVKDSDQINEALEALSVAERELLLAIAEL